MRLLLALLLLSSCAHASEPVKVTAFAPAKEVAAFLSVGEHKLEALTFVDSYAPFRDACQKWVDRKNKKLAAQSIAKGELVSVYYGCPDRFPAYVLFYRKIIWTEVNP